jgi:hypothetical protein
VETTSNLQASSSAGIAIFGGTPRTNACRKQQADERSFVSRTKNLEVHTFGDHTLENRRDAPNTSLSYRPIDFLRACFFENEAIDN